MDLAFLIDVSKFSSFNSMKDFIKAFTHQFVIEPTGTRVALVTYGSDASILFGFVRYCCRKELDEALDKLEYPSFVARKSATGRPVLKKRTLWRRVRLTRNGKSTHPNRKKKRKNFPFKRPIKTATKKKKKLKHARHHRLQMT